MEIPLPFIRNGVMNLRVTWYRRVVYNWYTYTIELGLAKDSQVRTVEGLPACDIA